MKIVLVFAILFLLLSIAVSSESRSFSVKQWVNYARRDKSIIYSRVNITILVYSTFLAWANFYDNPLAKGIGLFNGFFHVTSTTQIFNIFIFLISGVIIQLTAFYPRKVWVPYYSKFNHKVLDRFIYKTSLIMKKMGEPFKISEYSLIILFILTGGVFLLSSSDLISIYLSIELQSYGLYLLSTIYRNSEQATNGGLTYFLLGGLSSCFILLGTSLIYANSGLTNLDGIYVITSLSDNALQSNTDGNPWLNLVDDYVKLASQDDSIWYKPDYIDQCLTIFSVGLLFKASTVLVHFLSPDVYYQIDKLFMLKTQLETNLCFTKANVQSSLVLIWVLYAMLVLLISIIRSIADLSNYLFHVQIAFGYEIHNTKDLNTCYMESTGNDRSDDDRNAYGAEDESRTGEPGPSGTSPTDSESTDELADLNDECDRSKLLYDKAKEIFKSAMGKGDIVSAAEVARDIGYHKESYINKLDKLNELEDTNGYARTGSQLTKETVTSKSASSDDEYFAKPDDSRPTTPGELTNSGESPKPGFVGKKK